MSPPPLRAVLFDWDGTLVDSAESSFRCYARVFPEFGIAFSRADPLQGRGRVRQECARFPRVALEPPAVRLVPEVTAQAHRFVRPRPLGGVRGLESLAVEGEAVRGEDLDVGAVALLRRVHERAVPVEEHGPEPGRAHGGAATAALERIGARDLAQGIVSSGDGVRVRGELDGLGVARFFSAVICAGEGGRKKPHPDPLFLALARLGIAAHESAYVGDSPEDVEMARGAGAYAVGIPGGFPNREALSASGPDLLAESLAFAVDRLLG